MFDGVINARYLASVELPPVIFIDPAVFRLGADQDRLLGVLSDFSLLELALFSPPPSDVLHEALGKRIVGQVPAAETQHREMLAFLDATRQTGRGWIAITADASFSPDWREVIRCPGGFGPAEERTLRGLLAGL